MISLCLQLVLPLGDMMMFGTELLPGVGCMSLSIALWQQSGSVLISRASVTTVVKADD